MRSVLTAFLLATATLAVPAHATWYEASTDHFIIDADSSEARIRDFATKLERFDAVLRRLYNVKEDPTRRSNRILLFATSTDTIVKMCSPGCSSATRGFYNPHIGGSVIFTAALSSVSQDDLDLNAQEVLLHEYSHHFMFSNFVMAYPMWFTEGFAEYNANVRFNADGSVLIGRPANYRAYGLFSNYRLSIRRLLDPQARDLHDDVTVDQIYGRAWLLTHYLMTNTSRRSQLDVYLNELNKGKSSLDAGVKAFGDLGKLDRALTAYLADNRFVELTIPAPKGPIAVDVQPLSPGAAAMMPVHMRSTAGVNEEQAKALLPDAEKRAAPYPNDPRVQVELAEAEYDAGQDDAADSAADRALAADPANRRALLYKGRVAVRRAAQSHATDPKIWAAARGWYAKANRADPEAALPLLLYYQSYMAQGVKVPDLALQGLMKAETLAPEDSGVRWPLAAQMLTDGDIASARELLAPVAFAPHGARGDNAARAVIELIDAGKVTDAKAKMSGDKTATDATSNPPPKG